MKPNVLVIAGHDPSGGAGIHADIETIHSLGGLAATLITGLTVQNSQNVQGFQLVDIDLLQRQADALLADMTFSAVKIGMTGSPAMVQFIANLLARLPGIPVVLDPVLAAEAGGSLGDAELPTLLRHTLLPLATLATPNLPEAEQLAGCQGVAAAGQALRQQHNGAILITGTHDDTEAVHNHLFSGDGEQSWRWPRLPGSFHGSGCTLASACAVLLAQGLPLEQAISAAQDYVYRTLQKAWQAGQGQLIPDRRG